MLFQHVLVKEQREDHTWKLNISLCFLI